MMKCIVCNSTDVKEPSVCTECLLNKSRVSLLKDHRELAEKFVQLISDYDFYSAPQIAGLAFMGHQLTYLEYKILVNSQEWEDFLQWWNSL